MTGRSFQTMSFENEDDLYRLLYCAYWVGTGCDAPYEIFERTLRKNPKYLSQAIYQISHYNTLSRQFSVLTPVVEKDSDEEGSTPSFMGDIAAHLVVEGGLDARYVMRDMTIEDMLLFIKAIDNKQRQTAESQRMWTYISILPHVDKKKLKTPQNLIMFPWEVESRKQEAEKATEELKAEFEAFMRGGAPNLLKTETQKNGK